MVVVVVIKSRIIINNKYNIIPGLGNNNIGRGYLFGDSSSNNVNNNNKNNGSTNGDGWSSGNIIGGVRGSN